MKKKPSLRQSIEPGQLFVNLTDFLFQGGKFCSFFGHDLVWCIGQKFFVTEFRSNPVQGRLHPRAILFESLPLRIDID